MSLRKIAIIPARSGSKGLTDKNILDFCGKPMLAYSIEAALQAGCFDHVILSTDSEKYGAIGESFGAEIWYRNEQVSNDTATTFMVLEDLFQRLPYAFDYFMLLQPTSPLRDATHVREAVALFEAHYDDFDFLVSVKEADHNHLLVQPIDEDLSLKHFDTDFANYRRQNSQDYSPNGAVFVGKKEAYLVHKHFFGRRAIAYKMTPFDSVDIDTALDYKFAKLCMEEKLQERRQ